MFFLKRVIFTILGMGYLSSASCGCWKDESGFLCSLRPRVTALLGLLLRSFSCCFNLRS